MHRIQNFVGVKMTQGDFFQNSAVNIMNQNASIFSEDFLEWLPQNLHIFDAFTAETVKIINRGFSHYSSVTIVEFLRHHTAVTEEKGEWKINNNYRPYLARLFDLVYPHHKGLFEYRTTNQDRKKGE